MDKRISEVIEKVVSEGTFTPQALKAMQDAIEKTKAVEAANASLEKRVSDLATETATWRNREAALFAEDSAIKDRAAAVTKRETAVASVETRVAVAEAKEGVRKEVFETLFKNVTVRRAVTERIPISQTPSGGSSYVTTHERREDIAETQE